MLTATLLALGAAVLHAGWNLAVKQSGDRFIALWGQFSVAGAISLVLLVAVGGMPAEALTWAALSGLIHVPYAWFLARAYDHGDFSLVYPMARGGGALLAAIGGVLLLDDDLGWARLLAVVMVAGGLFLLAGRVRGPEVVAALAVAVTIGAYSVIDAKGIRTADTAAYTLASFVGTGTTLTAFALATGRRPQMVLGMRANWRRYTLIGIISCVTYGMVQYAWRLAPVGYVTAIRESSVLIAAFAGSRLLGEESGTRRTIAAAIVLAGLILLVAAR